MINDFKGITSILACIFIGLGTALLFLQVFSILVETNQNAIETIGTEFSKKDIICFESRPTEIRNGTLYIGYNETCYTYKINGRYREIGEMIQQ